jgi:hypothetical protein
MRHVRMRGRRVHGDGLGDVQRERRLPPGRYVHLRNGSMLESARPAGNRLQRVERVPDLRLRRRGQLHGVESDCVCPA